MSRKKEKNIKDEQPVKNNNENQQQENVDKKDDKELKIKELEEKINELNDKYLRLYSEFENYRKRTQKEKLDLIKTAGEEIILELLPVIDDFDRAEKSFEEAKELEPIKEGVKLIHHKILNILKSKGLKEIESSVGKELDIEKHEAITQIPAPNEEQKGKIIDEVEKGYELNGKVIRYTKVVVGQ